MFEITGYLLIVRDLFSTANEDNSPNIVLNQSSGGGVCASLGVNAPDATVTPDRFRIGSASVARCDSYLG